MCKYLISFILILISMWTIAGETEHKKATPHPGLVEPGKATEIAPDTYRVKFATTQGDFLIDISREWAPKAADRFFNMVKVGYFKDIPVYRVVSGFIAQFGFSGDPAVNQAWFNFTMTDEPVKKSNLAGTLVFANRGRNTRSNQFFINMANNTKLLDPMGFAPFGVMVGDGLAVVKSLYSGYGERGPNQNLLNSRGNEYAKASFPKLDYIIAVTLEKMP